MACHNSLDRACAEVPGHRLPSILLSGRRYSRHELSRRKYALWILPAWHAAFADIANRYADLADAEQQQRAEDFEQALSLELGIQGRDALWDWLFEDRCDVQELEQRLSLYFERLRGEVPGSQGNRAREAMMARWIRWAMD